MQGKGTAENLAKLHGNFSGKDAFGEKPDVSARHCLVTCVCSYVPVNVVCCHDKIVVIARQDTSA